MKTIKNSTDTTIQKLADKTNNTEKEKVITFNDDGKTYYFSNELGHKTISYYGSEKRPMTKREFKTILAKMTRNIISSGNNIEERLKQIKELDFSTGHANQTFEIITPCLSPSTIHSLVINLGTARYIYNQERNTVVKIDHSKRINGIFLPDGPIKNKIINKITSSKTMVKKIAAISQ